MASFRVFDPYTTRECEKVFGPLLPRLMCDVTAYPVAANVRRHQIAVSAVLPAAASGTPEAQPTVASITPSLSRSHDSETCLSTAVLCTVGTGQPAHCPTARDEDDTTHNVALRGVRSIIDYDIRRRSHYNKSQDGFSLIDTFV
jgi:hypothetical protein